MEIVHCGRSCYHLCSTCAGRSSQRPPWRMRGLHLHMGCREPISAYAKVRQQVCSCPLQGPPATVCNGHHMPAVDWHALLALSMVLIIARFDFYSSCPSSALQSRDAGGPVSGGCVQNMANRVLGRGSCTRFAGTYCVHCDLAQLWLHLIDLVLLSSEGGPGTRHGSCLLADVSQPLSLSKMPS